MGVIEAEASRVIQGIDDPVAGSLVVSGTKLSWTPNTTASNVSSFAVAVQAITGSFLTPLGTCTCCLEAEVLVVYFFNNLCSLQIPQRQSEDQVMLAFPELACASE